LKREPGLEVQVVDGDRGELTVLVDGEAVATKGDTMPEFAEVVEAVREAGSVADSG
jgi:hypothetical protein